MAGVGLRRLAEMINLLQMVWIASFTFLALTGFLFLRLRGRMKALSERIELLSEKRREMVSRFEDRHTQIDSEMMTIRSHISSEIGLLGSRITSETQALRNWAADDLKSLRDRMKDIENASEKLSSRVASSRVELLRARESLSFLFDKHFAMVPAPESSKEDITVVIGVRNRQDYRIRNALASIRNQTHPQHLIRITVVDYGSRAEDEGPLRNVCREFSADYIRIDGTTRWNRAHCLNIGIKRSQTKYILTSDVDMVFDKVFFFESIAELRRDPYQIIFGEMLDSLEGVITSTTDMVKDFDRIKEKCVPRSERKNSYDYTFGMSILCGLTCFFKEISGHDETYAVWGSEDDDIAERLRLIGLKLKKLPASVSYIHQWHPESVSSEECDQVKKNKEYFMRSYTIKRNPEGWGELTGLKDIP